MRLKRKNIGFIHVLLIVFSLNIIFSSSLFAAEKTLPLLAEQAFNFSISIKNSQEVMAIWRIAPGYYLYRNRFNFSFDPKPTVSIHFPKSDLRKDTERGYDEAYTGNLIIPISLTAYEPILRMRVAYQGCSAEGFCYPPVIKNIALNLSTAKSSFLKNGETLPQNIPWYTLLQDQNGIRNLLNTQQLGLMLAIFMGLGLLLAFTPCVLPMIPILTSIIVGHQTSVSIKRSSTRRAFFLSLFYVLGMAITYAMAGLIAALLGSSIQIWLQKPLIIIFISGLFALLALSLFGFYDLRLPHHLNNQFIQWSNRHKGGSYLGVFFMGMISTLIVSPCVTAPLIGVLLYISQTGDVLLGTSALFVMGIGMGIPLILIGISAGRFLPKTGQWMEVIKKLFGIVMLAMAVWILSRVLSSAVTYFLTGLWLLCVALFFGTYLPQQVGWYRVNRCLSVLIGLTAILFMAHEVIPRFSPWSRIEHAKTTPLFTVINSMTDLHQQLVQAQMVHKPVILDFYADWCESCVVMDKNIFSKAEVMQVLANFILLRADLSENTSADEALLKNFNVIAPPTMLFFNRIGQEVNSHRIVGEVNKQEFLTRLSTFITANCDKKLTC